MSAPDPAQEQPFISHLLELRDRLLRMVLAVAVVTVVLLPFANRIYTFVAQPLMAQMPAGTTMIATEVASPFLAPFKLTLVVAVFVAIPYLLYQLWAFVAPGLYQHERVLVVPLVASSVVLFYLGAAFAYFLVFPMIFGFFTATAPEGVAVMTDINHYLDFVLTLFFAFGLAFEVPIAVILLVWAGVIEPEKLKEMRPYVIVGAFVIGMFLTPPDVFSQTFLAVPMWLLFEAGVWAARFFVRREDKPDEAAAPGGALVAAAPAAAGMASAPNPAPAPSGGVSDHRPLTSEEMEAELDRIEAEEWATRRTEDGAAVAGPAGALAAPAAPAAEGDTAPTDGAASDGAEDPFARQRAAQEKLERVMDLRMAGETTKARQLLYEVLVEGTEDQVFVARNILGQLDASG
jgi:sec-independent protein translocase protein TatC